LSSLLERATTRARDLSVPLSVHFDLTWRCNERCIHCYLDHDDLGELNTTEILRTLDQIADSGCLFLTFSGGEILLRKDLLEILEHARRKTFAVKLKTNGTLATARDAKRFRDLGITAIQISIYSHRDEVHDAITKVRGSLQRSLRAIRLFRGNGLKVVIACVLMRGNTGDYADVQALAESLEAEFTIDPTITPHISGDRRVLGLRISSGDLSSVLHDPRVNGGGEIAEIAAVDDAVLDGYSCSAGHSSCYVSPYGDVYPCVQFPLPCGNVRHQNFAEIWRHSAGFEEVRSVRVRDLSTCSSCGHAGSCSRCPGLAYMEGDSAAPPQRIARSRICERVSRRRT